MAYVIVILNCTSHHSLYWHTPHEAYLVFTPDAAHLIELVFWEPVLLLKTNQIYKFDPFNYLAPPTSAHILPGHTKIKVHLVYKYNKYRRYKAHMVASGNMTGPNLDTY